MHRVATTAVLATAASVLAAATTFVLINPDFSRRLAAHAVALTIGATSDRNVATGPCRRLVGVWKTLGFELVIRPDDTAYDPGADAVGTMTCVGQTVRIHWSSGENERFTVSPDDDRLTQSGAALGVQYGRASRDIPPDRYGPPAAAPLKGLDLSGL